MEALELYYFCFTGVDVVLNSLAEDKLKASVRVLATHGKFLEIGKYDLAMNTPLGKISDFISVAKTCQSYSVHEIIRLHVILFQKHLNFF